LNVELGKPVLTPSQEGKLTARKTQRNAGIGTSEEAKVVL